MTKVQEGLLSGYRVLDLTDEKGFLPGGAYRVCMSGIFGDVKRRVCYLLK